MKTQKRGDGSDNIPKRIKRHWGVTLFRDSRGRQRGRKGREKDRRSAGSTFPQIQTERKRRKKNIQERTNVGLSFVVNG